MFTDWFWRKEKTGHLDRCRYSCQRVGFSLHSNHHCKQGKLGTCSSKYLSHHFHQNICLIIFIRIFVSSFSSEYLSHHFHQNICLIIFIKVVVSSFSSEYLSHHFHQNICLIIFIKIFVSSIFCVLKGK